MVGGSGGALVAVGVGIVVWAKGVNEKGGFKGEGEGGKWAERKERKKRPEGERDRGRTGQNRHRKKNKVEERKKEREWEMKVCVWGVPVPESRAIDVKASCAPPFSVQGRKEGRKKQRNKGKKAGRKGKERRKEGR